MIKQFDIIKLQGYVKTKQTTFCNLAYKTIKPSAGSQTDPMQFLYLRNI